MEYRDIPSVDRLLKSPKFAMLNRDILKRACHIEIEILKKIIKDGSKDVDTNNLTDLILKRYKLISTPTLKSLVNATGVVLHTNLGRAKIDKELLKRAVDMAGGYCNLEYDIDLGNRGDRSYHLENSLQKLFGDIGVLAVNNNASALFLILNTFAKDKEAIISRGELIEIGGSFRLPEVIKSSGALLKEVGTTNKTHLRDYKEAIGTNSSMIIKVHKSNFHMEGFCSEVDIKELTKLSKERGLIDYYDLGSASIEEIPHIIDSHISLKHILKQPPSLLSFSADKLFGSIQAGIIIGKKELIKELKRNQIMRMFRLDKITISILQQSVEAYIRGQTNTITTLYLLQRDKKELYTIANSIIKRSKKELYTIDTVGYTGGGTLSNKELPSVAIVVEGDSKELHKYFRQRGIIGRIEKGNFLLDMLAVTKEEIKEIVEALDNL